MTDLDTLMQWRGHTVLDRDGERLGKLGDLYLDDSDRPAYGSVRTGLFGRRESIIPLDGVVERDGNLVVPFDAALVRDAPSLDPDEALEPEEEQRLSRHYAGAGSTPEAGADGEMVRSEEEVRVRAGEMQPAERVRLRKVLVTENVETTVPVRREEVRLESEPPPEGRIERTEDVPEA